MAKETYHVSSSKARMSYGNQSFSSFKGKAPMHNEGRQNTWYDQGHSFKGKASLNKGRERNTCYDHSHASTSSGSQITSYYYGLLGHMKVDFRKRLNDLKSQRFQNVKKYQNEKRFRKINYFQKVENENLENKKRMSQQNQVKSKQV